MFFLYFHVFCCITTGFHSRDEMGVYDFFKGKCPNCPKMIDEHPEYGQCGDIQTKYFIVNDECFRSFQPGDRVPFIPETNFVIGRTCCCDTIIKVCFERDRIVEYTVAIGKDKFDYIQEEMQSTYRSKYVPCEDKWWFLHYSSFFKIGKFEQSIVQEAFHPKRIEYYMVQKGYHVNDICV